MHTTPVNLANKFNQFTKHWSPKIIAQMNDYHFKLVKFQGEFIWHDHQQTDEAFLVLNGEIIIHFRTHDVTLKAGELLVVPKGIEHKTSAIVECQAMLIELANTINTGATASDQTSQDEWI